WLQQGSRGLFGNMFEDDVYILIDTSQSMKDKLSLVKEKIFQLIQEQLRHKKRFNFVKFSAQAVAWQEKLAEVNEENLQDAWLWIKGLEVGTSTNTLRALQIALADTDTQAIYLLTDGRPDQRPQTILAQVQLHHKIPIHTVSFNCDDTEANKFLHELATETGGRFHYYNIYLTDPEAAETLVSEDMRLLRKEIERGERDLEKVKNFHDECLMMDWYNGEKDTENKYVLKLSMKSREESPEERVSPEKKGFSDRKNVKTATTFKDKLTQQEAGSGTGSNISSNRFEMSGVSFGTKLNKPAEKRSEWNSAEMQSAGHTGGCCSSVLAVRPRSLVQCPMHCSPTFLPRDASYSLFSPSCAGTSSARWLRTHGLVARRLTILDALAPTAVPHDTTYIPVLDKHVGSKVFDEVLSLAHVSSDKKRITLINPQAVNLDAYKEKLEQAIKSYERQVNRCTSKCILNSCFAFFNRRLNLIIWRALPQDERDKFKEDGPVQYMQNKEALLEALEKLGWPISHEDVILLEDEILTALTYKQQASDLQEAVKKETEKSSDNNKKSQSKKRQKGKVFLTLRSQKVIARSDITGFYYPGTVIKNISSTHALVDFVHGEAWTVPVKFMIPVGGAMPCPCLQIGDYVFARTWTHTGNDYYVPAVVISTPKRVETDNKLYTVLMFNNRKEHCVRSELIKISQTKYAFSCRYIR
ncbi:VWA3B protein, partial [Crypturellus undulatus]|nr:VWA3B protein [Crypturellus undulatus]